MRKQTATDFIEFAKNKGKLSELTELVKQTGTSDKKSKSSRTAWTFFTMLNCDPKNYISEMLRIVECDDCDSWLRMIPEWREVCNA